MKKFRFWAAAAAMLLGLSVPAQETRDIDVTVRLRRDGSALVTQKWDVTVTKGTEWFIPVNILDRRNGMVFIAAIQQGVLYEGQTVRLF